MSRPVVSERAGSTPEAGARLRLIRRRSRGLIQRGRATRFAPVAVLTLICAGALVFAVLLEQVILAQSAFKLSHVRRRIATAEARNQELLLQMTKLQSPRRIERFARERLGMVDPDHYEYIVADVGSADRQVAVHRPPEGDAGASERDVAAPGPP